MYKKNLSLILIPFLSISYILLTILFMLAIAPSLLKYLFSGKHKSIQLVNNFEKLIKKTSKFYNQKIGLLLISNIAVIIFSFIYSVFFTYNNFFESILISFSLSFLTVFVFMVYWNVKHVYTKYYYFKILKSLCLMLPNNTNLDLKAQKIIPLLESSHKYLEINACDFTDQNIKDMEELSKSADFLIKSERTLRVSGGSLISDIILKY